MPSPHYHQNISHTAIHEVLDHHAYYPVQPRYDEDVRFEPYYSFLPENEPHTTFHNDITPPLLFNQNDNGTWFCQRTPEGMKPKLPTPGTSEFETKVNEYASAKWGRITDAIPSKLYSSSKTPNATGTYTPDALPDGLLAKLCPLFSNDTAPWYHFQKQNTLNDLKTRGGVGDKRAHALKHPAKYAPHSIEANAFSTVWCPECDETFQAPYYDSMEETIDYLSYIVYCPNCKHQDIPTSHIDDPIDANI